MSKKIAVVARERQSEAFRMAIGMVLLDDTIEMYVLDRPLEKSEDLELYLETFADLELNLYSNLRENEGAQFLTAEEIAHRLPEYDHVLVY